MYIFTYLYILPEISAYHLQLKCMGSHFFPGHPYIESTTVLSDIYYRLSVTPIRKYHSIDHKTIKVLS